jgi:hypothetical protein
LFSEIPVKTGATSWVVGGSKIADEPDWGDEPCLLERRDIDLNWRGLVSASQAVRASFLPRRILYIHTAWASEEFNIPPLKQDGKE